MYLFLNVKVTCQGESIVTVIRASNYAFLIQHSHSALFYFPF